MRKRRYKRDEVFFRGMVLGGLLGNAVLHVFVFRKVFACLRLPCESERKSFCSDEDACGEGGAAVA